MTTLNANEKLIKRDGEIFKKSMLDLKNATNKMKTVIKEYQQQENIKVEDKNFEIIQTENNKGKSSESPHYLWNTTRNNMQIIGVPEKERKKGIEI